MNAKTTILIIILILLGIFGGYYLGANYKLILQSQGPTSVTPTPTPGMELLNTPGTQSGVPSTVATTPVDETATVINMVKQSEIARIGADANSSTYAVTQIQGNYAKGTAGSTGGGAQWFAGKVNGTWKLIFIGNGTVDCSLLTNFPDLPKAWLSECWDSVHEKSVVR